MHTGYDIFWMFQKNRQEPLLNLQKNDNCSPALLTDFHKQVQNGVHPGHMNSYLPPKNNVATSHPDGQPGSQYMWSSSVYSQPLKPSYVSNFHPQEAYLNQPTNLGYSVPYSQPQQSDLGYCNNPNTSVSEVCSSSNNNYNNSGGCVPTRDIDNTNVQTPRIRVRDVFSLNNSSLSNKVFNSNLYQDHQKKQQECCVEINHNTAYSSQPLSEFVSYAKGTLSQSNVPLSYYQHMAKESAPYAQNSSVFYQTNAQPQLHFGNNRHVRRNFNVEVSPFKTTDKSICRNLVSIGNNQEPNIQTDSSSDTLSRNKRVQSAQNKKSLQINNSEVIKNSGYINSRLIQKSSNCSNIAQIENEMPKINGTHLLSNDTAGEPASSGPAPAGRRNFQNGVRKEGTVVKISIPHKGHNSYITIPNCDTANSTCNLSLTPLLESDEEALKTWNENSSTHDSVARTMNGDEKRNTNLNVSETETVSSSLHSSLSAISVSDTSSPAENCQNPNEARPENSTFPRRKKFCGVVEPLIDVNKKNMEEFLNSNFDISPGNFGSKVSGGCGGSSCSFCSSNTNRSSSKKESIARETIFQTDITQNALRLKQENVTSRVESPRGNVSEGGVWLESIKIEGSRDNESPDDSQGVEDAAEQSQQSNTPDSVVDITENVEFTKADIQKYILKRGFEASKSETPSGAISEPSTKCLGSEELEPKGDKEINGLGDQEKSVSPEMNYKSRINRSKLHQLIQFLANDEERDRSPTARKKSDNILRKRKLHLNHNRRKLSRTAIVKNKNNSREMISMVSHKNSRVEVSKCSSQVAAVAMPSTNSDGTEETKMKCAEEAGKAERTNLSDKREALSPTRASPPLGKDFSEAKDGNHDEETSNGFSENYEAQKQKNIINTIRGLHILKTVYCGKCDSLSTLDSCWINVASGELRCLKCLKKMVPECKGSTPKSRGSASGHVEIKDETEKRENVSNDADKSGGSSKLDATTKTVKEEPAKMCQIDVDCNERTSEDGRKETTGSPEISRQNASTEERKSAEERTIKGGGRQDGKRRDSISTSVTSKQFPDAPEKKHESKEGSVKASPSVENRKKTRSPDHSSRNDTSREYNGTGKMQETEGKSDKSVRRGTSKETEIVEEHSKTERKGTECPIQSRKKSDSKDCTRIPEEDVKKEAKVDLYILDKFVKKIRESHHKENAAQQTLKRSIKIEQSEKTKTPPNERCTCHIQNVKSRTDFVRRIDTRTEIQKPNSSEESRQKSTLGTHSLETHKVVECAVQARKRKHSDEGVAAAKIRLVEEHTQKDAKPEAHKANVTNPARQDAARRKTADSEPEDAKSPNDKVSRKSFTKEEGEISKRGANQITDSPNASKSKAVSKGDQIHQKLKTFEQTKHKGTDFAGSPKRKTKQEHSVKLQAEAFDAHRGESASKEQFATKTHAKESSAKEIKNESIAGEDKEKNKKEEREKNRSSGKTPKTERDGTAISSERPRVRPTIIDPSSRPLKDSQNTKRCCATTERGKYKSNDWHEDGRESSKNNSEDGKERKRKMKNTETVVTGDSDKKSSEERTRDKNQIENKPRRDTGKKQEAKESARTAGGGGTSCWQSSSRRERSRLGAC